MQVNQKTDQFLHHKLPIDEDEQILGVYRHHWFAYASNWIVGIFIVIVVMTLAIAFTTIGDGTGALAEHRGVILAAAGLFSVIVLLGTFLPVYLRMQEQVVLTEEALLQILQPSLFSSKIDQLNLQHIADVSVKQDFFGTIFGFGHITIETPGEQDNYEFNTLPTPHQTAKEIVQAHENYTAAMQGGRMPSTLGFSQPAAMPTAAPGIDPQQYQQFLQYQQMVAQQQAQQAAPASAPAGGPAQFSAGEQAGQENNPTNPESSDSSQSPSGPNQPGQ